jgi:hypothetical protein
MDLDIDLGSLLRPTARAAAEAAETAQHVIYPMVPSWHRDGAAASTTADVAADPPAAALFPADPGPAATSTSTPPPMRSAEAWVPTQSARLGTWPVPAASNDMPDADVRTARAEPRANVSPRVTAQTPVVRSSFVALPLDAPVAAPASSKALVPAASPIASAPPPEGPAQRRAPLRTVVGAHGQRWLQALSVGLRPVVTARCHPHVIERLAAAWPEPQAAAACLDDLLFNRRPGRRGFSLAVLGELCELQRALAERRRR